MTAGPYWSGEWLVFAQKNAPLPPSAAVVYDGVQPIPVHVSGVVLQRQPPLQLLVLHALVRSPHVSALATSAKAKVVRFIGQA